MSINISRGQSTPISDYLYASDNLLISFGWNEAPKKNNFFTMFTKTSTLPVDCDIATALLSAENTLREKEDLVFHNNKIHKKTGAVSILSSFQDISNPNVKQQILIGINNISKEYEHIVFIGTIYDSEKRKHYFNMLENIYIEITNVSNGDCLCHFDLQLDYSGMSSMFFGELFRTESGWSFNALGNGSHDTGITQAIKRYQP